MASHEVVRLQTALRDKEERLANTVVSYLVRETGCGELTEVGEVRPVVG